MKPVLFMLLLAPFLIPSAASASYLCQRSIGVPMPLSVDESEPAQVVVSYGNAKFSAELSNLETGVYGQKVYALTGAPKCEGDEITGSLTITQMPKTHLGGGVCGRRFCPPDDLPEHLTISATLIINEGEPVEFSCDETAP